MKRLVLVGSGALHRALVRHWARMPLRTADVAWVVPGATAIVEEAFMPAMAGEVTAARASVALQDLADAAGVSLVVARPASLDPLSRILSLKDGRRAEFDLMSVDVPGEQRRDGIEGAQERALPLRASTATLEAIDRVETLARERPLDVVVFGAGAPALEAALALQARLGSSGARLAWACGSAGVLPDHPPGVQALALATLRRHRVTVLPDKVVALSAEAAQLASGVRAACDVALLADTLQAPAWLPGESDQACSHGWPALDAHGRSPAGAPVLCWSAAGRASALRMVDQIARALGGGALLPLPAKAQPMTLLYSGLGRGLWFGHGLVAEGRLPGWLRRWKLRRLLRDEGPILSAGR